ncbi:hypothetical protein GH141_00995 [bacterium]|nr:hypothetical protein [bacterium]
MNRPRCTLRCQAFPRFRFHPLTEATDRKSVASARVGTDGAARLLTHSGVDTRPIVCYAVRQPIHHDVFHLDF